jgi:uncharacterized RDD family membrane protein YckC
MMNDTVREEMQSKITAGSSAFGPLQKERTIAPTPAFQQSSVKPPLAPQKRIQTSGLSAMKTSPTLVEFQHKNKAIPDWRLQLQNAVQQRKGVQKSTGGERQPLAATNFTREGRKAAEPAVAESPEIIVDPRVANAMRRIAESRKTFLEPDPSPKTNIVNKAEPSRPFGVVPVNGTAIAVERAPLPAASKPTLVDTAAPAVLKRDTNKLPRIEIPGPTVESDDARPASQRSDASVVEEPEIKRIRITVEKTDSIESEWPVEENEDIEDLAPFSMRFGAGLFDLIIGVFVGMLLLSPLVFAGLEWMTWSGLLTLVGTAAVVLFVYMTACLGFFGKTPGMKLFSLELVDAVENDYPTLRQSAINSSIFLLSLTFAGAGFITLLFNEEKRAIHDLLSGTILVREF